MKRTTTKQVTFARHFVLGSSGEVLPPGTYDIETDEELLEGVSFAVFRRILTLLHLHPQGGIRRTLTIDPDDLDAALLRDRSPSDRTTAVAVIVDGVRSVENKLIVK